MFLMIGGVPRRFSMYNLLARAACVWSFFRMGCPDVVFFIPGLLCSNVFRFWHSYCTHGHKLGVAAGGILVGKSFWHLLHSKGHSFMWMARIWLCLFLGNYGVQGSI